MDLSVKKCFSCTEFGVEFMELKEMPPLADFITVHVPLIPQTKGKEQFINNIDPMANCDIRFDQ